MTGMSGAIGFSTLISPQAYAKHFRNLKVFTIENGLQIIDAGSYRATGTEKKNPNKFIWRKFQQFLRDGKRKVPETGEKKHFQQADFIVDPRLHNGKVEYHWNKTLGPFNGKGTPELYERFLTAIDFYLTVGCKKPMGRWYRPAEWSERNIPSLEDFAEKYIGVDCNGMVGGFFKTIFPDTGWHVETDWNKNGFYKGPKRSTTSDLKTLDVLVQYLSKHRKHVAMVGRIYEQNDSSARIEIVQSASSKGGIFVGDCTLKIKSNGEAETDQGYKCNFNKGVYGVMGANETTSI